MGDTLVYTRHEAARMLRVGLATIDRRITDGSLRSVKLGRRRLIPADAITEALGGRLDLPTVESVSAERAAQSLPPTVEDPAALARVDAAIGGRSRQPAA